MPYSRHHCRFCGRPATLELRVSSRGRCTDCALARIMKASHASVMLSIEVTEAREHPRSH